MNWNLLLWAPRTLKLPAIRTSSAVFREEVTLNGNTFSALIVKVNCMLFAGHFYSYSFVSAEHSFSVMKAQSVLCSSLQAHNMYPFVGKGLLISFIACRQNSEFKLAGACYFNNPMHMLDIISVCCLRDQNVLNCSM